MKRRFVMPTLQFIPEMPLSISTAAWTAVPKLAPGMIQSCYGAELTAVSGHFDYQNSYETLDLDFRGKVSNPAELPPSAFRNLTD